MNIKRPLFALALLTFGGIVSAQTANPREALDRIQAVFADAGARQKRGEPVSEVETRRTAAKIAQDAVQGVDPNKVPFYESADWLRLFEWTDRKADIAILSERTLAQRSVEMMSLQSAATVRRIEAGDFDGALRDVRNAGFMGGIAMLGQFHAEVRRALETAALKNLDAVMAIYDAMIDRVHFGSPLGDSDKNWGPVVYAGLCSAKYSILYNAGKKDAALKSLRALEKQMAKYPESKDAHSQSAQAYVTTAIRQITSPDTQSGLVGKIAPTLMNDRALGEFAGLSSLKGKVVILDFMAHWCGPCKAAFPDLVKLQSRLGMKGLQIVSLTGYYGYFGERQGISKEQEFEAMRGFVKDYGIAWPVLFDGIAHNNSAYGVTGIPQLVVIDRKGIVRKVEVGYLPADFQKTVKEIEAIVAEG